MLLLECLVSFGGKSAKELCGRGAMSVIITVCVRISFVNRSKSLVFHFCLVFITTLSSREQPLVPVGPTDRRCSYVSPIILAVANNYFRGGATVRGEKQTKYYCGKLRSARHFSQRLIKMFRIFGEMCCKIKHKKYMNPLRTS